MVLSGWHRKPLQINKYNEMKKQNEKLTNAALLRQRAEELLQRKDKACLVSTDASAEADILKLIHELEVHQIELEMQNEELVIAKEKAELAEEKYTELYDFAPSGYIALSRVGEILELNFAAANMLGKERTKLIQNRFVFFVSIDTQTKFNLFLPDVFTSKVKQTCEVIIATEGNLPIYVNIDGIVSQNNEMVLLTLIDITERKSAERNLLEEKEHVKVSENKFRTLSENSPAIIYRILLKPSFKFEYVSPAVTEITGYTPEDHYADPELGFKMVHPDDRMILEKAIQKTQGEPIVLRWVKKDGKIIWTEQRSVLIFDLEGKPIAIEGIAVDITLQKQAEEALKKSEEKMRSIYSVAPAGIGVIENRVLKEVNPVMCEMTGYTREELIEKNARMLYASQEEYEFVGKEKYNQIKEKGTGKVETLWQKKDGSIINVLLASTLVDKNDISKGTIFTALDITERKRAELLLQNKSEEIAAQNEELNQANIELIAAKDKAEESETRFRNLMESIDTVAVQGYGPNGITQFWNKASEKLYGYTQQEAIGSNLLDLIIPSEMKDMVKLAIHEMTVSGKPIHSGELLLKHKDGSPVPVISHHTIVKVHGHAQELFCLDIDITERKQAEMIAVKERAINDTIIESTPGAFYMLDENGRYVRWNAYQRDVIIGKPDDMVPFTNAIDTIHPEDRDLIGSRIENVLKNGIAETVEGRVLLHGGPDFRWMLLTGRRIVIEEKPYLLGIGMDITERKQTEEKLFKSEERFALVIEASEQGIWDWNVETNEVFFSEQWKKQIGYNDDELKNEFNTWVEHLHPNEKEYCQNAVNSYLNHPVEHFILDFRFRHKDGTYRWLHNKAASLKNKEGKVIRLFGTHTDITESKLNEAIFKDIIEKNPISIQILDMEGYPIQVNSAHTNLFGVEPPSDYSVLKDTQLLSFGFSEYFEQIKNGEVVYFPDTYYNVHDVDPSFPDSPIWVKALGFTLNDNNGKPNKIVLMHENITESKNAEALLNDIIENNPMSIQIVDKEGCTLRVNPTFLELFGSVPPPQFSIFDDLKSKSPEMENLVSNVINGEIVHLPDIYFNANDAVAEAPDIPLWIRALIFPLKDSAGKPKRFVLMHENITERKQAEQELVIAKNHAEESDRLKSAFLANMSHEIRTPMNGILGFAEVLKDPDLSGEQQQKYIGIIEKSGARMLNIINDIIDISKIEAGLMKVSLSESNINEQIEYIYTFFKPEVEAKGIQLFYRNALPEKSAFIHTDREKIYAILTNLVKNAIKYTRKGSIEFGYTKQTKNTEIMQDLNLQFYVRDTGIGIPKDRQQAIFERFIQADISDRRAYQGAGLGLSITKAYVEMLNGKIWVESEEGIGSCFYFTIPFNGEQKEKSIIKKNILEEDKAASFNNLKILIADDDDTSRMLISMVIKKFSKEILEVETGVEALEVCRNNPDIDLIIMDVKMPEMDGYEATKKIREFNNKVIIIIQTAFALSGEKENANVAGCNDYLSKPFSSNALTILIKKYFNK
jgi:PAS domain S-box-containing protein